MARPITPEELAKLEALSKLGSFGHGAAQGATFGFGDEVGGVVQTLGAEAMRQIDSLRGTGPHRPFYDPDVYGRLLNGYRANRDSFRREDDSARAANPKTFALGNLAGGLVTAPLAGGANTARAAATAGAIAGLGGSEADLTKGEVGGAAYDTAKGAATGLAVRRILQGKGLGGTIEPTAGAKMAQAGFRHAQTGAVIPSGAFHDLDALEAVHPNADLSRFEQGFIDDAGRFYTRSEAASAVNSPLPPDRALLAEHMFEAHPGHRMQAYDGRAVDPTIRGGK